MLVDKVFSKQIGRNLEAYVDDMVIKGTSEEGMLSDIQETFERFWSINMKLNPKKCSFGVEEGLFLGHLITKQGIKVNPSKIKAKVHWTDEADKAFKEMKKFFQALPTLTAPRAGETLIMYLTASKESINAALFVERIEGHIPIYFVSKVLQGAELNNPALEKFILALVHAVRRLRRYFQAHTIMVLTGTPIKQALTGSEKTERVTKWAIELDEHDIIFLKRDKRETPVDFLSEIPFDDSEKRVKENEVVRGTPNRISYSPRNGNHETSDIPRLATSGKPNKGNLRSETAVNQKLLAEGKDRTKGIRRVHS
nr:retrovirus-related Pol polyprotein from transposon 17.6 [Tanacetum cinerariifolium]